MTTETRLTTIVNKLGMKHINAHADKLFEIKYCKCDNDIKDLKPVYESHFGCVEDKKVHFYIPSFEQSIELKAVKKLDICLLVIKSLEANYAKLILSRAEQILIMQGNMPIVRLDNIEQPNTNIVVSCDIQLSEPYLESIYKEVLDEEFNRKVISSILLGTFSYVMIMWAINRK